MVEKLQSQRPRKAAAGADGGVVGNDVLVAFWAPCRDISVALVGWNSSAVICRSWMRQGRYVYEFTCSGL